MKILVTGAQGRLGRSLLSLDTKVERLGCSRGAGGGSAYLHLDLTDGRAVAQALEAVRPDWVIHTAALTDVDRCETERALARSVNLDAVEYLVEACARVDAGLVQLSTDYVFDGVNGPYSESDPTNPLSYYGQLKLASEQVLLQSKTRGFVARTTWLFGYVPGARRFMLTWLLDALSKGQSIEVVDDQWGNPTYVHDLAQILVDMCLREVEGVFHIGGTTFLTRYEMVVQMARFFALDQSLLRPIPTAAAGQKAKRPLRSGLRTEAVAALLGRVPLGLEEGLVQMERDPSFKRDFAHLK